MTEIRDTNTEALEQKRRRRKGRNRRRMRRRRKALINVVGMRKLEATHPILSGENIRIFWFNLICVGVKKEEQKLGKQAIFDQICTILDALL